MNNPLLITLNNYPESCHLCRIGHIKDYADAHKWRTTDHFGISMVKKGNVRIHMQDSVLYLKRGDIYISYPGVISRSEFLDSDTEIYSIEFTKEFLEYDSKGTTIKDRFIRFMTADDIIGKGKYHIIKVVLPIEDQMYVNKMIERFHYEFSVRREGMFDLLQTILIMILNICGWKFLYQSSIQTVEKKYNRVNEILADSVEYIHKHFNERLTVGDIVERFGTSRTIYCTMFKQVYGVTFYEYLTDIRREKAIQLLIETDMSMEAIAEASGFFDNSTLYRKFMKYYGISPGRYRKENSQIV